METLFTRTTRVMIMVTSLDACGYHLVFFFFFCFHCYLDNGAVLIVFFSMQFIYNHLNVTASMEMTVTDSEEPIRNLEPRG